VAGRQRRERPAQAFYARSGFAVVGERRFTVGNQVHHDLVLHQTL
jgi:hypothetical protein